MIEFASGQITGKRAAQEDALDVLRLSDVSSSFGALSSEGVTLAAEPVTTTAALDPGVVLAVADGMGGHVGGRVASTLSIRAFLSAVANAEWQTGMLDWGKRLEAGLLEANSALSRATAENPGLDGMGSTLTGAVICESGIGWVSIGDTALYLYRGGVLTRLNEDHSFGAYLDSQVRDGLMTPEQAASDRRRNHLFYALLGDTLDHFESFSGFRALYPGDVVLVASDGLKTISDEDLAVKLGHLKEKRADKIVRTLLDDVAAADRDRQDNVSIVAARIGADHSAELPTMPLSSLPKTAANDAPATHRLDDHVEITGIVPPPTQPRAAAAIVMPRTTQPRPAASGKKTKLPKREPTERGSRVYQAGLLVAGVAILAFAGFILARLF